MASRAGVEKERRYANRGVVGSWEKLRLVATSGGYALACQGASRYVCDGAGHKVVEACATGCSAGGAGADDVCVAASVPACTSAEYAAQNDSGTSYCTCQGTSRYVCDGNGAKVTELCTNGCTSGGAGVDDECR